MSYRFDNSVYVNMAEGKSVSERSEKMRIHSRWLCDSPKEIAVCANHMFGKKEKIRPQIAG